LHISPRPLVVGPYAVGDPNESRKPAFAKRNSRSCSSTAQQKAVAKVVAFGIGVALSGATNYALTQVVEAIAIKFFEGLPASDARGVSVQ
jgi:hypothetical protein